MKQKNPVIGKGKLFSFFFSQIFTRNYLALSWQYWRTEGSTTLHCLQKLLRGGEYWGVSLLPPHTKTILYLNFMEMICILIEEKPWHRCLKCLQQVKLEYSLVKSKLETLFKVRRRSCRELIWLFQLLCLLASFFYLFACSLSNSLLLPVGQFQCSDIM